MLSLFYVSALFLNQMFAKPLSTAGRIAWCVVRLSSPPLSVAWLVISAYAQEQSGVLARIFGCAA